MKVLLMHANDGIWGGAQIQLHRLRNGLLNHGLDASILCREAWSPESVPMPGHPLVERCLRKVTRRLGLNDVHLTSSHFVHKLDEVRAADVIDLHCLHGGVFSYLALPSLTAGKPVVFTFHDMWPITGHCHASLDCDRWRTGCGNCPHLDIEPAVMRDATATEWKWKRRAYRRSKFTIVTPSRWLHDRVRESMLADFPVHHIPHGLDLAEFRPLDKAQCRNLVGIPAGLNVIACCINDMARPLKGAELLIGALEAIPEALRRETVVLFFGRSREAFMKRIPLRVIDLGYVHSERLKAIALSAADLVVNPSRAESFGLVALESMACGTPVVCFGVGGLPELVRHGQSGLVAPPDDPASLGEAVSTLLRDVARCRHMGAAARRIAEEEYSIDRQIASYINLYQSLVPANR